MRSEQAVVAEAEQVAAFLHPDAGTHEVAITPR
jgi:hypothetical protein